MTSNFVARGAAGYDGYMGRWSQRLAPSFLEFAGVASGERVLDVGCGTGNLAFELAKRTAITAIEAIDFEEQFVEALRQRNTDPRIKAQRAVAHLLGYGGSP